MSHEAYLLAALVILLAPATFYDVREYRIPNWLTLSGCVGGLTYASLLGGFHQLGVAALGLLIAFLISLPFWLLGWMGAGDVKLIAAVGSFLGTPAIFKALPLIAFSGLLLALIWLAGHGLILKSISRWGSSLGLTLAAKTPIYVQPAAEEQGVKLPYAIAITSGTIVAVLLFT